MARELDKWMQEQAEREILSFIRDAGNDSHVLRIVKDGPRWLVARSRLCEAPGVGEGESFGQAWFESCGSSEAEAGALPARGSSLPVRNRR